MWLTASAATVAMVAMVSAVFAAWMENLAREDCKASSAQQARRARQALPDRLGRKVSRVIVELPVRRASTVIVALKAIAVLTARMAHAGRQEPRGRRAKSETLRAISGMAPICASSDQTERGVSGSTCRDQRESRAATALTAVAAGFKVRLVRRVAVVARQVFRYLSRRERLTSFLRTSKSCSQCRSTAREFSTSKAFSCR